MDFEKLVKDQRELFLTDTTKKVEFRLKLLNILLNLIKANEEELYKAIFKDLGKSEIETYSTELSVIYSEINYYLKNLEKLIKPKLVAARRRKLWYK